MGLQQFNNVFKAFRYLAPNWQHNPYKATQLLPLQETMADPWWWNHQIWRLVYLSHNVNIYKNEGAYVI